MSPDEYRKKIKEMAEKYKDILNDKSYYCPKFNAFNNTQTKIECDEAKKNLENMNKEFLDITNILEKNIDNLAEKIKKFDKRIDKIDKENNILKPKLNSVYDKNAGSQGMFMDSLYLYNQYLAENIFLILIMIIFYCIIYLYGFVRVSDMKNNASQFSDMIYNNSINGINNISNRINNGMTNPATTTIHNNIINNKN